MHLDPPAVTVVIITRNRRRSLLRTLDHLRALPERPPVIVVDNGSTDGSVRAVGDRYPEVTAIAVGANLGPAGRNLGVARASTRYVAFSDDDSWWDPGALDEAAGLLDRSPDVGLVAARVLVGPDEVLDPTSAAMATSRLPRHPATSCPTVLGFLACGAVVRREAYLGSGGFHPDLAIPGEEALLALDLASSGWQLVYAASVVARHHPEPTGDRRGRARRQVADAVLVAWMRLPVGSAVRATLRALRSADGVAPGLLGSIDAVRRWRWAVSGRRVVPSWLAHRLRLL
jgi:GT2 family glycosyltransferase